MLLFHIFVYSERTITFRGNRLLLHTEDAESNKISFFNLCYNYNSNLLKRSSIALKPRSKQCPHWLSTLLSYVSNLIKVFHATTMNLLFFSYRGGIVHIVLPSHAVLLVIISEASSPWWFCRLDCLGAILRGPGGHHFNEVSWHGRDWHDRYITNKICSNTPYSLLFRRWHRRSVSEDPSFVFAIWHYGRIQGG